MGKKQIQDNNNQTNKGHKTLRDKLRKKREELKKHKKEKSQKHKQYNVDQQKKKFFKQTNSSKKKRQDGIKVKKLNKYIEKFVDIYEDDVEDFYELFGNLDEGGSIDITDVADPKMQKCLKKMFKYLPLKKKKLQYEKKEDAVTKLKPLMIQLISKSIENYLENGTDKQQQLQQNEMVSSDDNQQMGEQQKQKKIKKAKRNKSSKKEETIDVEEQKKLKSEKQHKQLRLYQDLKLYPEKVAQTENVASTNEGITGPFIPPEQRQYLAKMFDEQIKKGISNQNQQYQQEKQKEQNNQFDRIFSMSTQKQSKSKKNQPKAHIDDIPQDLLAQGSARIGEKQQINPDEIQQYNKTHRPRKLIEEHQEMMRLGKYAETDPDGKKKRVPFDRERDVVNGRSRQFINNGVFFDFKQRMTKPKGTNNFL